MVLDSYRQSADRLLMPMARRMARVHPDLLTWGALVGAGLAGWLIYSGGRVALLGAFGLLVISSLLDALDGKVARITAKASPRGDFLDHTLDRYSDIFILGGVAFSIYCSPILGFVALMGVLMTSYMGTQAQAVGLGRMYGGLLGRADRLVIIMVTLLLQGIVDPGGTLRWSPVGTGLTALGWAMALFAVLGNATALYRAARIWGGLRPRKDPGRGGKP